MRVAVLDACILYPPSLRDLFMWQASAGAYSPRWTEEIHDEWMRNVLKDNPAVPRAQLERTRRLMDLIAPDCLITGHEAHIPALQLPDPDDRHVLAAAIQSGAAHIITFNLSDFPATALQPHGVRAVHPDHYLSALFDVVSDVVLQGVREHRASLRNPPKTAQLYIDALRAHRLQHFARRLQSHCEAI